MKVILEIRPILSYYTHYTGINHGVTIPGDSKKVLLLDEA